MVISSKQGRPPHGEKREDPFIHFPPVSISEAAEYLGVSRKTVYRLIEWGEVRAVKEGKALRVEKKSLDRFRESGRLT